MERVSIIMPAYNSEKYIEETINSVINQTFRDWVLYVIDDKSTDNTLKIVEKISENDKRIVIIKLCENSGQAHARNQGIKMSKGRYITFLDSDDLWDELFLEEQIKFMESNSYEMVFSAFERKNQDLSISYGILEVPYKVNYEGLLKNNYLSCLSTVIDTNRIGKIYFEENYKHEDHIMWIKILKDYIEYAYGNQNVLATYRIRSGSTSRNKFRAAIWKWTIYRNYLKLNIFKSLYYYLYYVYNGIRKNKKFISKF